MGNSLWFSKFWKIPIYVKIKRMWRNSAANNIQSKSRKERPWNCVQITHKTQRQPHLEVREVHWILTVGLRSSFSHIYAGFNNRKTSVQRRNLSWTFWTDEAGIRPCNKTDQLYCETVLSTFWRLRKPSLVRLLKFIINRPSLPGDRQFPNWAFFFVTCISHLLLSRPTHFL